MLFGTITVAAVNLIKELQSAYSQDVENYTPLFFEGDLLCRVLTRILERIPSRNLAPRLPHGELHAHRDYPDPELEKH